MGAQLLAVAVDRAESRMFLDGVPVHEPPEIDRPGEASDVPLVGKATINVGLYGTRTQADLFTNRQLAALLAFADAVANVCDHVRGVGGDDLYAKAVASVLGLCVSKLAMSCSTQVRWKIDSRNGAGKGEAAFGKQALPMVWDFTEANPFGGSMGDWMGQLDSVTAAPIAATRRPGHDVPG